jgi:hypothetical protein
MRILWQAIRATVAETAGVLVVVWFVFGVPFWRLQPLKDHGPDTVTRCVVWCTGFLHSPSKPSTTPDS